MSKFSTDAIVYGDGSEQTGIADSLASNDPNKAPSVRVVNERIDQITLSAGGNVGEIFNIMNYGAKRDVVLGTGSTIQSGTDSKTFIDKCILAAPNNAAIYVPSGTFYTSQPLAEIVGAKTLHWVQDGNIIAPNGLLKISGPGGADRIHTLDIAGKIYGKINSPFLSKAAYDANTGPVYGSYAGVGILINQNVNSMHARISEISGFQSGLKMTQGFGNGSQENTFAIQKINDCNYCLHLESTNGDSWCDKNYFQGWDDGNLRLSGNVGLKIDGCATPSPTNGEIYNGAFRSDTFHFIVERVAHIMEVNGDVTEPEFRIIIEGGTNTGVFGLPGIQCRSISPNYVRSPRWTGLGAIGTQWMQGGMGIDGWIEMQIWLGPGSLAYIGGFARIDGNGNIIVEVRPGLSQSSRNALPSNIKTANSTLVRNAEISVPTTATTYVVGPDDRYIYFNKTSGTTAVSGMPSVATSVGRDLTFINKSTGTVTVNGRTLAARQGITFHCTGSAWEVTSRWTD
jgi:hypothetical protein